MSSESNQEGKIKWEGLQVYDHQLEPKKHLIIKHLLPDSAGRTWAVEFSGAKRETERFDKFEDAEAHASASGLPVWTTGGTSHGDVYPHNEEAQEFCRKMRGS